LYYTKKERKSNMNLWNWLNGKKTFIGLAVAVLYYAGVQFGWYQSDATVEAYIASWTGLSLVHKAVKA
jgi:hypothetical protein